MATKKSSQSKKPAKKVATPKKSAAKKVAAPKKAAAKKSAHGARLVEHLTKSGARFQGKKVDPKNARVAALLGVAAKDPTVRALFDTLIARNVWFGVGDLQTYAEVILRGKQNESWNAGGSIIGEQDLVVAKNGAGDVYVWNAADGSVRFLVHDEGWTARAKHKSFDDFLEASLWSALENLDADELEDMDDDQRTSIALAVKIAGEDALDDEVREKLEELGVI